MIYLALSIACSVAVSVLLKLAPRYGVAVPQAVAVNYAVAALWCVTWLNVPLHALAQPATAWPVLVALGMLLPTVFLALAASVRHAGIVRTDAAQRLSLVVPLLAAFLVFGETLSPAKGVGLVLALVALACLGQRPTAAQGDTARVAWMWPLAVWAGYGLIDILFKQMARAGAAFGAGLLATFLLAGVLSALALVIARVRWQPRHVAGGVLLGCLNFGNILFYLKAHQHYAQNPALVFSAMNVGVIALGTLVGAAMFGERLGWRAWLGLGLAVVAVLVMRP